MATKQIKDLTAQASPANGDFVMIQQSADDATRKTTILNLLNAAEFNSVRVVTVPVTATATDDGDALKAAYVTAKGLSPTLADPVLILLRAGVYDMGASGLTMDTDYISVIGEGPLVWNEAGVVRKPLTQLTASAGATITVDARNAALSNLQILRTAGTYPVEVTDADRADGVAFVDCWFSAGAANRYAVLSTGVDCASTFINCASIGSVCASQDFDGYAYRCYTEGSATGSWGGDSGRSMTGSCYDCWNKGPNGFGGNRNGSMTGRCERCVNEGDAGFAGYNATGSSTQTLSGVCVDCRNTGDFGFGGGADASNLNGIVSGTLLRCRNEGGEGFSCRSAAAPTGGVTGTLIECEQLAGDRVIQINGGKVIRCLFKNITTNGSCIELFAASYGYHNVLIGDGSGKSVYAATAQNWVGHGNAMNLGLDANVTNIVTGSSDATDADIDL